MKGPSESARRVFEGGIGPLGPNLAAERRIPAGTGPGKCQARGAARNVLYERVIGPSESRRKVSSAPRRLAQSRGSLSGFRSVGRRGASSTLVYGDGKGRESPNGRQPPKIAVESTKLPEGAFMSNKQNTPSLADLVKAQNERQQAEERRQEQIAEQGRVKDSTQRTKWNTMTSAAEVAVSDINKELSGTGVSVEFVKIPAEKNSFSYGSVKATVHRASGSKKEYIEFQSTSMGIINVMKPRPPRIGENSDLYFKDAEDDTLANAIRAYLTEAFSA